MNNYSLNNQMKQLEIAEARRKMGTPGTGISSQGLSNYSPGYNSTSSMATPSLSSSTATGYGEMQNARQQMNQSSYTTNQPTSLNNYQTTPSLSSSTSVGYDEREKAKQNMNTTSLS